jgi:HD-GYP domain-containing protein (c-di-GMP phosphodiesterase class II)/DNA-binding response OmpR family regulator
MAVKRLGERLVEAGLVSADAVTQALAQQKITGNRLGDCLVDLGLIQETALLRFLASEFKTRFVSAEKLAKARIPPEVLDKVPVRMAEQQCFIPLAYDSERKLLSIVMAEPQNLDLVKEIQLVTAMEEVFPYIGLRSAILAAIKKHYYGDPTAFAALEKGGVAALKSDVASVQRAWEAGSDSNPRTSASSLSLQLETDPRARTGISNKGTSSRVNPTQLREALGAVRGTVGENDFVETLNILVGLLEMNRKEFRGHSAQVARQSSLIARRIGLQPRDLAHVSIAAYLHDLGKRADKHFTLTSLAKSPELRADAKRYVRAPIKLFETVHLSGGVNTILMQLYEAFDGSGIPQGAKGEDIHAGSRIIAAVDDFLDLTRNPANAFGRVLSKAEALAHLTENAGKLFDAMVVDALAHLQSGDLLKQRIETDGRYVLVADPDEGMRTDLLDALSKLGLPAQTVLKLDGVVDALQAGEGDVVCVGLAYGANDLSALLQWVRTRPESASVPVVILGEPTDTQAKDRLLQAGVTNIVPVPLNPEDAATMIRGLYSDRIENGGPGHIVRGSYDELAPLELVRIFGRGRKSGRLQVRNGPQEGFMQMEKGRVIYAAYAGKMGEEALDSLLTLTQAEFSYEPETLPSDLPHVDKDLELVARELEAGANVAHAAS